MSERIDGRLATSLRPLRFESGYVDYPEGSVLISMGNTRVLCNVSMEDQVPRWMKEQEKPGGWVTAEYSMLPRATHTRNSRETKGLRGRTQEISRLIGRSLRAAVDLSKLGARSFIVDCDVLQADGGTRCASICGGYVALQLALQPLIESGEIPPETLKWPVAAVSVGLVDGTPLLDLCYEEDVAADLDFNVVMTAEGEFIEVQGTAEGDPFPRHQLDALIDLAAAGIADIVKAQASIA